MSDRTGIFAGDDPIALVKDWLAEATKTEINDPNAATMASVDEQGRPNMRIVLIKEIDPTSFVFYTNYDSVKGREILSSGYASFCLHWKSLRRQIRVRGTVEKEDGPQADAYYASRPYMSRIGAHASLQSQSLPARHILSQRFDTISERFPDSPPRPENWGGIRVVPYEIEFWADGKGRLHDRFRWTLHKNVHSWEIVRLYP